MAAPSQSHAGKFKTSAQVSRLPFVSQNVYRAWVAKAGSGQCKTLGIRHSAEVCCWHTPPIDEKPESLVGPRLAAAAAMDGGKKDGTYFPAAAFFWPCPAQHAGLQSSDLC